MVAEQLRSRCQSLALLGARAVDVADRGQGRPIQFLEVGQQQVAARAAADQRHGHAVVSAQHTRLRSRGHRRRAGRGDQVSSGHR